MLRPAEAFLLMPKPHRYLASDRDLEKSNPTSEDISFSTEPGTVIEKVNVDLLEVGDIVRVQSGSTPPCDGRIVSVDSSAFDESSLTGESRLIKKGKGDLVYLGTINKSRMVDIEVNAIGGGTM
jgi:P-type E1-E2 ATPase